MLHNSIRNIFFIFKSLLSAPCGILARRLPFKASYGFVPRLLCF